MESGALGPQASKLLSCFLRLPEDLQQALSDFAARLSEHVSQPTGRTLHSRRAEYRVDGADKG